MTITSTPQKPTTASLPRISRHTSLQPPCGVSPNVSCEAPPGVGGSLPVKLSPLWSPVTTPPLKPATQTVLLNTIRIELYNSTFQAETNCFPIQPSPDVIPPEVFTEATKAVATIRISKNERETYVPIARLLNALKPNASTTLLNKAGFIVYDREMADKVGGSDPLKPDLLLRDSTTLKRGDKSRWRNVVIAVEVKGDWKELVAQAATYARAMFSTRESRISAPVIGINYKELNFRWLLFHRGGLLASPLYNLKSREDLETVLSQSQRIWSWNDTIDAGWYSSTFPHPFKHAIVVSNKNCVCGRANCVCFLLESLSEEHLQALGLKPIEPKPIEPKSTESTPATESPTDAPRRSDRLKENQTEKGAREKQEKIAQLLQGLHICDHPQRDISSEETLEDMTAGLDKSRLLSPSGVMEPMPSVVVIKTSWPRSESKTEADIWVRASGKFGLPTLWAYQVVGTNEHLCPDGAQFWDIFGSRSHSDTVLIRPQHRMYMKMLFTDIGRPFIELNTPVLAVRALVHAVIGHYILLSKFEILHRDISEGNVLGVNITRSLDDEICQELELDPLIHMGGMLIDGDLCKYVGGEEKAPLPGRAISGTAPFLSVYVLSRWKKSEASIHTPMDDLESGCWLLLKTALLHNGHKDDEEAQFLQNLDSGNFDTLLTAKRGQLYCFNKKAKTLADHPIYSLLLQWFSLLIDRFDDDERLKLTINAESYRSFYREFLKIGFDWLRSHAEGSDIAWELFWEKYQHIHVS